MERNKNRGLIGVLVLVGLFFFGLIFFATYTYKSMSTTGDGEAQLSSANVKNPIGVVEIKGVIMDSEQAIEKLQLAEEKESIKAIIVRIDSPGGAVGPTQEIYEEILRIDKIKPVYASFGSIAASGGYYIGAAARKIFSNPGTLTGSIGVIMQFADMSKLYEFAKVNPEVIKAGKYKDAGNPHRSLTTEERTLYTSMLQGVRAQFVEDIMRLRKDKIKGKIDDLAQGQIFSGKDALDLGLVDELGGLWQAGRSIHDELGIEGKFGLKFIKLKKKFSWTEILENVDESVSGIREILGRFSGTKTSAPQFLMAQ